MGNFSKHMKTGAKQTSWKLKGNGIQRVGKQMGKALPLGPGSAVLPEVSWTLSPFLVRCPVSGPAEGAVLAWLTGSGRVGKEHEWRAPAVCPKSLFPVAHTRLCTSSFPRHLSRVLGRVIVLRSALWQNCLQWVRASVQVGVKGENPDPYGHLFQSRPPTPRFPPSPSQSCSQRGALLQPRRALNVGHSQIHWGLPHLWAPELISV